MQARSPGKHKQTDEKADAAADDDDGGDDDDDDDGGDGSHSLTQLTLAAHFLCGSKLLCGELSMDNCVCCYKAEAEVN